MALKKFWIMAYRDLVRNKRRTAITFIAIAMGLTLVIFMNGLITGMLQGMLRDTIRLDSGHVQLRAESYEVVKTSLLWRDLLGNADELAAQAAALPEVKAVSPILWAGGILGTASESTTVRVSGIDPTSALFDPIREGLRAGEFLSEDGRREILIGQRLADELGVSVGDRINLAVGNPEGLPEEGSFNIVGLINTGFPGIDNANVFLSLAQAQAITGSGNRASTVRILLHDMEDTDSVVAALQTPGVTTLDWRKLNEFLMTTMETGTAVYAILYAIIFLVVAVIIANTLLMSVFERTREMGILAALGMKGRQIMMMFLFEATILGLIGSIFGMILGAILVYYYSINGIYFGDLGDAAGSLAFGDSLYTALVPANLLTMSFWMLIVIVLVSLYPAWYAARLEPVEALHAL
ncbi:MAG: ABC transporter permease [Chloroflexi bacterium]|nr:MAG: ABC transporter permease [Chloroflexota bacterium]